MAEYQQDREENLTTPLADRLTAVNFLTVQVTIPPFSFRACNTSSWMLVHLKFEDELWVTWIIVVVFTTPVIHQLICTFTMICSFMTIAMYALQ